MKKQLNRLLHDVGPIGAVQLVHEVAMDNYEHYADCGHMEGTEDSPCDCIVMADYWAAVASAMETAKLALPVDRADLKARYALRHLRVCTFGVKPGVKPHVWHVLWQVDVILPVGFQFGDLPTETCPGHRKAG